MYPEDIYFTETHEWLKVEGNTGIVGITSYAVEELGDIVGVELPEVGAEFSKDDPMGVVESVKSVSDINAPVSGKILKINEELENSPELMNEDPYGKGWFVVMEIEDESELSELMNAEQYASFVESEA